MDIVETHIEVLIPAKNIDLVDYFQNLLDRDFVGALDFDVVAQADRAVLDDVCVINVTIRADEIEVEYSFEYSAHIGCRDKNWTDGETSSVIGVKIGDKWVFDKHIPWKPRSTYDEF